MPAHPDRAAHHPEPPGAAGIGPEMWAKPVSSCWRIWRSDEINSNRAKEKMIQDHAIKLLIHDLSNLRYMIERYSREDRLRAQANALVEHRLDTFSTAQPEEKQARTPSA